MMDVYEVRKFPFVEFGDEIKRQVRLVMSPYTTGEKHLSIVHVILPPEGISEGHIHNDCDELIYFSDSGMVILDDKKYLIKKESIVIARKGVKHECVNTSDSNELILLCIFVPPFTPYGKYPDLIKKTNWFLK